MSSGQVRFFSAVPGVLYCQPGLLELGVALGELLPFSVPQPGSDGERGPRFVYVPGRRRVRSRVRLDVRCRASVRVRGDSEEEILLMLMMLD